MDTYSTPPISLTANPASESQISFVKSLVAQKDLGEHVEWMAEKIKLADDGQMDKRFASKLIGRLRRLPDKPLSAGGVKRDIVKAYAEQTLWAVPSGRYALVNDKADQEDINPVLFYRVTIGNEGSKWEGRRFVNRIVGGNPDMKIGGSQAMEVLRLIHGDILGAASLYGKEFKHCSRCNRELTRRLSRELGIGPHCAAHLGMSAEHITEVKATLVAAGLDPEEAMPV